MSHFTVLVNCGSGLDPTDKAAVMARLGAVLAPYDENVEVDTFREYETREGKFSLIRAAVSDWTYEPSDGPKRTYVATLDLRGPLPVRPDGANLEGDAWRAALAAHSAAEAAYADQYTDDEVVAAYTAYWGETGDEPRSVAPDGEAPPEGSQVPDDATRIYTLSTRNPLSRWDWWSLGGRWAGLLSVRDARDSLVGGEFGTGEHFEMEERAARRIGIPVDAGSGLPQLTSPTQGIALSIAVAEEKRDEAHRMEKARRSDVARAGDIDFDSMRAARVEEAGKHYDRCAAKDTPLDWSGAMSMKKPSEVTREAYIEASMAEYAPGTFAILDPSEGWFAREEGGWGPGSDPAWSARWLQYVQGLEPDTVVAIVDCHI